MAYYNANIIVKLTRTAIGITQEELSDGICDVTTLSRLENGHCGVNHDTYRKMMMKMKRIGESRYAVCINAGGVLLEDRKAWEQAYKRHDYKMAELLLKLMNEKAGNNVLTRQYIARADKLIRYRRGDISAKNAIEGIEEAIGMTVLEYKKYIQQEKVFPFVVEELLAIISIANIYSRMGENEHGLLLYTNVLKCLNESYISEPDNTELKIIVKDNIARTYSRMGKYEMALEIIESCIRLCIERNYGILMCKLLVAKAHNTMCMEKDKEDKGKIQEIINLLQQARDLAVARDEIEMVKRIDEYCNKHRILLDENRLF